MAQMQSPNPPFNVQAISAYAARNNAEVSLEVGKVYTVLSTDGRGLWWQTKTEDGSSVGWFPASYTQVIESAPPAPTPVVTAPVVAEQYVTPQPQITQSSNSVPTAQSAATMPSTQQSQPSISAVPTDRGAPVRQNVEKLEGKGAKEPPCSVTLHVLEAKDLQGTPPPKMVPTVFIYKRDVMSDGRKAKPLFTLSVKAKTNAPKYNEEYKLFIRDAELEVVCLRFCAKADFKSKGKDLIGELEFPLRGAVRKFDRPNGLLQWFPIKGQSGERAGEVLLWIEFFDSRSYEGPKNVKHEGHVGLVEGGGFEISNIPQEWKQLFRVLNIKKKDLENNADMAKEVFDIMTKAQSEGTIPSEAVAQATQPAASRTTAPAPPPMQTHVQTQPAATVASSSAPPPPPMPSGPKPPPPPVSSGPKPPPPPSVSTHTETPAATTTTVSAPPPPAPSSGGGGGGGGGGGLSLFDQIKQGGHQLKKAQIAEVEKGTASTGNPLADTLISAMSKYRADIAGNDKAEDEDDWSD